jgi:hypothetical protein
MNARKYAVILVVVLGVLTLPSAAQTWIASRDFAAMNPNGAWSYGWGVTGTTFALYGNYYTDCSHGVLRGYVCWTADVREEDHTPVVSLNTTGLWQNSGTVVIAPSILLLHPAPDWDPGDSIVQWTAPMTATYRISGFFEILDTNPSGTIELIYRNDTLIYSAELLGPPAQHPNQPGGRADFSFPELSLNAGDVISFGVNYDGTFYYDATGFNVTIATGPIPPPCSACTK